MRVSFQMDAPAMRARGKAIVVVLTLALSACAGGFHDPFHAEAPPPQDLGQLTYQAVDHLLESAPDLVAGMPVVVSTITDTQQLDHSTPFGNIVADFVRSRLAEQHSDVSEPRLRAAMLLRKNEGEMMLGRDSKSLVPPPLYSAILTGTYAAGGERVYVTLRLISVPDSHILGAVAFVVWRNDDINALLGGPPGLASGG